MILKTKESKKENMESRFAKVQELRKFHQGTLDAIGAPSGEFIPKMAYIPKGMSDLHVGFFQSELSRGVDFFTEFVNKELEPEDPERQLYLWKYNPHWSEEYVQINNGNYTWFMVPVAELYKVDLTTKPLSDKKSKAEMKVVSDFEIAELTDSPISDLSIRDLAAILLNKPVSNKKFLNDIILNNGTERTNNR
jgi:hypothetical protein